MGVTSTFTTATSRGTLSTSPAAAQKAPEPPPSPEAFPRRPRSPENLARLRSLLPVPTGGRISESLMMLTGDDWPAAFVGGESPAGNVPCSCRVCVVARGDVQDEVASLLCSHRAERHPTQTPAHGSSTPMPTSILGEHRHAHASPERTLFFAAYSEASSSPRVQTKPTP